MITAICQECKKQFDYELKPGFPRKYCFECGAIKKAQHENKPFGSKGDDSQRLSEVPVVRPGLPVATISKDGELGVIDKTPEIKKPTGEYQSLVYNKTLSANSYEVGVAGNRFKLYFETVEELKAKLEELKSAGFPDVDVEMPFN